MCLQSTHTLTYSGLLGSSQKLTLENELDSFKLHIHNQNMHFPLNDKMAALTTLR